MNEFQLGCNELGKRVRDRDIVVGNLVFLTYTIQKVKGSDDDGYDLQAKAQTEHNKQCVFKN